jgi:hypothetical protein
MAGSVNEKSFSSLLPKYRLCYFIMGCEPTLENVGASTFHNPTGLHGIFNLSVKIQARKTVWDSEFMNWICLFS